jgi:hypothetical protein
MFVMLSALDGSAGARHERFVGFRSGTGKVSREMRLNVPHLLFATASSALLASSGEASSARLAVIGTAAAAGFPDADSALLDGTSNKFMGAALVSPFFVPKTGLPSLMVGPSFGCAVAGLDVSDGFPRFRSSSFFLSSPMAFNAAVCAASTAARLVNMERPTADAQSAGYAAKR